MFTETRAQAAPERARFRLIGTCAGGCSTDTPSRGCIAAQAPHDGPGVLRWVCRPCMLLAATSQAQRDRIDAALRLPAADTGAPVVTAAGRRVRCADDMLGGV